MEDISLHILDIAENSIAAGSTLIRISLMEDRKEDVFRVEISDNGKGIPDGLVAEVLNPFYTTRTTRKIGLGLSLLAQSARETGGTISIKSAEGAGTVVTAEFRPSHIDMKPLGNVAETLVVLIAGNPLTDFIFSFITDGDTFSFDTRQMKKVLEEVPINSPDVLAEIRKEIKQALDGMKREVR